MLNVSGPMTIGKNLSGNATCHENCPGNNSNVILAKKELLMTIKHLHGSKVSAYTFGDSDELVKLVSRIDDWDGINVIDISKSSDNRPLTVVAWAIFEKRNFFENFGIDKKKMLAYLMHVEDCYHDCHYHNRLHAADVTHSVHVLLNTSNICSSFSDLEMFQNFFT